MKKILFFAVVLSSLSVCNAQKMVKHSVPVCKEDEVFTIQKTTKDTIYVFTNLKPHNCKFPCELKGDIYFSGISTVESADYIRALRYHFYHPDKCVQDCEIILKKQQSILKI